MESNSDELSRGADEASSSESEDEPIGRKPDVIECEDEGLQQGISVKVEVQEVNEQANEESASPTHRANKRKSWPRKQFADSEYATDWKRPKRKKATPCPDCGNVFENAEEMKRHAIEHQVQTRHKCEECGRCFSKAFGLKTHRRMHGEKNQHCPLCEAAFTQPVNLNGSRPSLRQKKALAKFLERNLDVVKGFSASALQKMNTGRKWKLVARTLNKLGDAKKDGPGWSKYWTEKKCHLKKLCKRKETFKLSNIELRLVDIIGKSMSAKLPKTPPKPIKSEDDDSDLIPCLTDEESSNEESEITKQCLHNKSENSNSVSKTPGAGLRPSYEQVEKLVEFLEKHPAVAQARFKNTLARIENKKKWVSWAATLNDLGMAKKDGRGWSKYWIEKKCYLKKVSAKQETYNLSDLERKMLGILNLQLPDDMAVYKQLRGEKNEQVNNRATASHQSEARKDADEIDWQESYEEQPEGKKRRSTSIVRPNPFQVEKLLDILEVNPILAKALYKSLESRLEAKQKWAEIAQILNLLGDSQRERDGQGWAKFWTEKKCYMRKYFAYEDPEKMTPLEIRMMALSKDASNANASHNCTQQHEVIATQEVEETTVPVEEENGVKTDFTTQEEERDKATEELILEKEEETKSVSQESALKECELELEVTCEFPLQNNSCGQKVSQRQLLKLVEFLELNWNIAKGTNRTEQGRRECKMKWAKLANSLNVLDGVQKTGSGWAKYWTEKKSYLKKSYASRDTSCLTSLEKRMMRVVKSRTDPVGKSINEEDEDTREAPITPVVIVEKDPLGHSKIKVKTEVRHGACQLSGSGDSFTAPSTSLNEDEDSTSSNKSDTPEALAKQMSALTHAIKDGISAIRNSTAVIRTSALLIEQRTAEIVERGINGEFLQLMTKAVQSVTDGVTAIRENTALINQLREMTKRLEFQCNNKS